MHSLLNKQRGLDVATILAFPEVTAGGPGSGRHPGPVTPTNKYGKQIVTPKQQIAFRNARPVGKAEQDKADKGEAFVRNSLKDAVRTANNKPFDILTRDGKHGIEVKTLTIGANEKITMKREAMERKYKYANDHGMRLHTVVVDMRGGKSVKGIYYKEGVGSFRLGGMAKLKGPESLDRAIRSRSV